MSFYDEKEPVIDCWNEKKKKKVPDAAINENICTL